MISEKEVTQGALVPADMALRLQRQLDAAQQITHIGSWDWDLATGQVTWSDELYRIYGLEPRQVEICLEGFLARVHPDDRERVQREVSTAVQRGGRFAHRERIVRPDGSVRELDTVGDVLVDAQGRPVSVIGTCHDITDDPRERAQRLQAGERRALEMLAAGAPLPEILAELARLIEEVVPGTITSILLMDSGTRIKNDNTPSLPDPSKLAVHGIFLGSPASASDTALFRREPEFIADIETDPRWEPYRDMARFHGLRACWSYPILAADGHPLGACAVYCLQPRAPDPTTTDLVARVAHVTGIAIERRQLDERLRALSERTEAIREDERTRIAQELHGQLGQELAVLKFHIAWVARRLADNAAVGERLRRMKETTDATILSVERISAELRPGILDVLGLQAAIESQAGEFTRRTGIACELRARLHDLELDPSLATTVFRIFQEALGNVSRHAGASRVTVDLYLDGTMLVLEVADDGIGLSFDVPRGRALGLFGMGERARRLGGECVVRRREQTGTVVSLRVPLASSPNAGGPSTSA